MHRKTITITEEMETWVRDRIASGNYGNDSEYIRDLIRRDHERRTAENRLRVLIEEAEASGISDRSVEEIWNEAEKAALSDG